MRRLGERGVILQHDVVAKGESHPDRFRDCGLGDDLVPELVVARPPLQLRDHVLRGSITAGKEEIVKECRDSGRSRAMFGKVREKPGLLVLPLGLVDVVGIAGEIACLVQRFQLRVEKTLCAGVHGERADLVNEFWDRRLRAQGEHDEFRERFVVTLHDEAIEGIDDSADARVVPEQLAEIVGEICIGLGCRHCRQHIHYSPEAVEHGFEGLGRRADHFLKFAVSLLQHLHELQQFGPFFHLLVDGGDLDVEFGDREVDFLFFRLPDLFGEFHRVVAGFEDLLAQFGLGEEGTHPRFLFARGRVDLVDAGV